MFKVISKIFPAVLLWAIFAYVMSQVPYPQTLTQATSYQLFSFFIPLFLSLFLTINLFLGNIFSSSSISLGLIFLLILKALDSLNLVTATLILIAVGLLISYFKKIKKHKSLTNYLKIPKLTQLRRR